MITVTQLARRCGLSRSTVLYYESVRVLKPPLRTSSNYRAYSEKDVARLEQVCVYRNAGLGLADIRAILDRPESDASGILKRRLVELNAEIQALRGHQRAILKLLQHKFSFGRKKVITKEKWVAIMKASGFQRGRYAQVARRIRALRTGRTPGIPDVPPHPQETRSARFASGAKKNNAPELD